MPELSPDLEALLGKVPPATALRLLVTQVWRASPRLLEAAESILGARPWSCGDLEPWLVAASTLGDPRRFCPSAYTAAEAEVEALSVLASPARRTRLRRKPLRTLSPALAEGLLDRGCEVRKTDPSAAVGWFEDGLEIVGRLLARGLTPTELAPLRLRLLAHRANALRVACRLPEAECAFGELALDPGLPRLDRLEVFGEILSLEASLRIDQRRFTDAVGLLERAERLYRMAGLRVGVTRVLINLGNLRFFRGELPAAIRTYSQAIADLAGEEETEDFLMAQHNLAEVYAEAGMPAEAARILATYRSRYLALPARHRIARALPWLEGRIGLAAGDWAAAEPSLQKARDGFLADGLGFNAALVCLDLADLYRAQSEHRKLRRVAEQMAPVFEAQDVHAEAAAALALFQEALRAERADAALVAALRRYLREARHDPDYSFDPPGVDADLRPARRRGRRPTSLPRPSTTSATPSAS